MCLGASDCQPERRVYRARMNDTEKKARLAEALRTNLRKRKAQARAQQSDSPQRVRTHSDAE